MKLTPGLFVIVLAFANCAVIERNSDDIEEEGLYKASDQVVILGISNFKKKLYGSQHSWLVQFYNSFCGHCRNFAPEYKKFAQNTVAWASVIRPAVVDCSVEANTEICRDFVVMQYPSLRYFQPLYQEGNTNIGDPIFVNGTSDQLVEEVIKKIRNDQEAGLASVARPLGIFPYQTLQEALHNIPKDTLYTFLVFESQASLIGSELILDTHDYKNIIIKRVLEKSDLATTLGIKTYPSIVVVHNQNMKTENLTPVIPTKQAFLIDLNAFLLKNNYDFPPKKIIKIDQNVSSQKDNSQKADVIYYSDLEATIRFILHVEITRLPIISDEVLNALIEILDVLIENFVFKNINLKNYMIAIKNDLEFRKEWTGKEIKEIVLRHEQAYSPVYITNLEYVGCKGSQPAYRGYTCGLWTLFHTLTVSADSKSGLEGPRVLRAMLSFVKHFFGCTDCSKHFQQMAERNHLFDIKQNDKAVLWLWISHNEVNLRLAGDSTEDPTHPKIQFPSPYNCPKCRSAQGAWELAAVYDYLHKLYGAKYILTDDPAARAAAAAASRSSPAFSRLDIGLLSIPYIFTFVILLFALKLYLTKRFYRKKNYKHDGWGKV